MQALENYHRQFVDDRLRTGNQLSSRRIGVIWSNFLISVVKRAAAF